MKKWVGLGCGGLVAVVLLLLVVVSIGGCSSYNRLVSLQQSTESSWAQVQNVYQRRMDLIPNLVKTVEGAANFERSTLNEVIQARASATQVKIDPSNLTPEKLQQFEQAQSQLSSALSRLLVTVERYPDLKANANFRDLQVQLEGTENRITVERQRFNETARQYNTAIRQFPTALVARFGNFASRPYFEGAPGSATPPPVNFNFGRETNK